MKRAAVMRWLSGRGHEQQQQAAKSNAAWQMPGDVSPSGAGLTDDPAVTWDEFVQAEFGGELDAPDTGMEAA
jgi:hypothetical protein